MDKQIFYYREHITPDTLNEIYDDYELQLKQLVKELIGVGIKAGGVVGQHSPTPDGTVDITPLLQSYDLNGVRLHSSETAHVKIIGGGDGLTTVGMYDIISGSGITGLNGNAITLPTSPFNEKWVTILAVFDRLNSLPQIDGHGNIVYLKLEDSFKFSILQGTEGVIGLAARPVLPSDGSLCLADINLTYAMTTILTSNLDYTRKNIFIPALATQVNFTTVPQTVVHNVVSGIVRIQAQDAFGNLCPNVNGTVTLSVNSGTTTFSILPAPFTPTSSLPMVNGQASFYFRDTVAESITVTTSVPGLTSVSQNEILT